MKTAWLLAALAVLLTADIARAATVRQRIAVYDLRSEGELGPLAKKLSESILLHLGKIPDLQIVGEREIDILISHEKDKEDLSDCERSGHEACVARLTAIADAEKVITGHLGRLGADYLVTLSLADVKRAAIERGESCTADKLEDLEGEVARAVDRLLETKTTTSSPHFVLESQNKVTKIAVLELERYGTSAELASNLTQLLALELKKLDGLSVISRDEITSMLEYEAGKQLIQCKSDSACLAEIGGALGVDYLITGALGRVEDTFVIHLKLLDIARSTVTNRVSESFRGSERYLSQSLRFAAWSLLGRSRGGRGALSVLFPETEGQVSIDSDAPVPAVHAKSIEGLATGKHSLMIDLDGYERLYHEFYVEDGAVTKIRPDLVALPTPWYEQWWPWAIIGSAAAAGIAGSLVLATRAPGTGQVHLLFMH